MRAIFSHEQLARLYLEEKLSVKQIAGKLGKSYSTVRRWLHDSRIPLRGVSEARRLPYQSILSKEEIERLYIVEQLPIRSVAKRLNVSIATVKRWMTWQRIPRRTHSESQRVSYRTTARKPGNWKGGRHLANGYIRVKAPEHSRATAAGYVLEHILVWEKTHGRLLPENWCVHHINGIKNDNRPENLIALPWKNHSNWLRLHHVQAKLRAIEAENRRLRSQMVLL